MTTMGEFEALEGMLMCLMPTLCLSEICNLGRCGGPLLSQQSRRVRQIQLAHGLTWQQYFVPYQATAAPVQETCRSLLAM